MLNYNSPIMDTKDYSEIKISEVEPIIKINLRGKNKNFITKMGKELSIILPTDPNTSSGNDKLNILWLSPDEWLIYSNDKIDPKSNNSLEDKLFNEISIVKLGAVTNVTDHWVMINLKGKNVFELLSTGCPFNFNNFKNSKGAVIQTILNHTDVIIHNKDINDLNLFVRRSFSNHLWSWINDSSRFI
jgi:sarcosine oxidase subunit gamma